MDRTLPDTRPMPVIAAAIVVLTLTTAYIHFSLGGVLFTLNAAGYAAFAVALILITAVPHPLIRRFDWAPRIGLAGYAALTIGAYLVIGPYFTLGWIAKGIEVAILVLLAVDLIRLYGSPRGLVQSALSSLRPGPGPMPAA
jgi:phosphatidylserine synthase